MSSTESNFGPVFIRGRKAVSGAGPHKPPAAALNGGPTSISHNPVLSSQSQSISGLAAPAIKSQVPLLGSFSPVASLTSLPLSKSFSAVVSPGKEIDERPKYADAVNGWDTSHRNSSLTTNTSDSTQSVLPNGTTGAGAQEYSCETLLNLYSEEFALKLPPDLDIHDPAVTSQSLGMPLALTEMTDEEKDLFAGPFNSERRIPPNKLPHHNHNSQDTSPLTPVSPEGGNGNLNKLSVGGGVKLAKHAPNERFTSLGIQGGVLAGVASPTHSNTRRRGEGDNDVQDSPRRFTRPEDSLVHTAPWNSASRDRRSRDSGPPTEGKWKRGVQLDDKASPSTDNPTGGLTLKYSVLDRMREKAAAGLEAASKDPPQLSPAETHIPKSPHAHQASLSSKTASAAAPTNSHPQSRQQAITRTDVASKSGQTLHSVDPEPTSQPISAPESSPEDTAWQYRDPSGTIQGPFTAFQMQEWYKASFFRDDLLVKRILDNAFETLETLILRVGDRDRPFLARPPPALPPNLPLPTTHLQYQTLPTQSQTSSALQLANTLDQVPMFSSRSENAPALDSSSLFSHANSIPSQLGGVMSAPDPWSTLNPSMPTISQPNTLSGSPSMVTGTGWNPALPAFAHSSAHPTSDFNPNNGLIPNSFVQPDALRFLQQMQIPGLTATGASGYPFTHSLLPHPPAFGQIPAMHHMINDPGLDPLLAAQLHAQLGLSLAHLRPNPHVSTGPETTEQTPGTRDMVEKQPSVTQNSSTDPWHLKPEQAVYPPSHIVGSSGAHLSNSPVQVSSSESSGPTRQDSWSNQSLATSIEPIGTRSSGKTTPVSAPQAIVSSEPDSLVDTRSPTEKGAISHSETLTKSSLSPKSAPTQVVEKPSSQAKEGSTHVSSPTAMASAASDPDPLKPNLKGNVTTTETPSPSNEQPWQNVHGAPTANKTNPGRTFATQANTVTPKQTGKVVVLTRAQQDEQDRRTASIQKTQLQLKEAQAVERAAREASEAAAAAAAATALASINTPAPWSKEEKPATQNLTLTEIQAIEAKQVEKRRQLEKQAAASRALAEQIAAAERATRSAKESLPSTTTWANSSGVSPTKISASNAPWGGSRDTESVAVNTKQSMKQIQEEEVRKQKIALQQQNKSAAGTAAARVAGAGYGSVVAAGPKPAVTGPWSVVGAKSKVVSPPSNANRPINPAAPSLTRATSVPTSVKTGGTTAAFANSPKSATKPTSSSITASGSNMSANAPEGGPPPASPEFMKWLREALRGMNNVDDFVKMLLDFPIDPDETVLEIVSDSVYAGSATLDGRRFAKEFKARRYADVMGRLGKINGKSPGAAVKKPATMADAVKLQPTSSVKNDGWGFAVVGAKKKRK